MTKHKQFAEMTQERQSVINIWQTYAHINHLRLNDKKISDFAFKAKVFLDYNGGCICLPQQRPVCPCPQCINECKTKGMCHCTIFCSEQWYNEH